MHRYKQALGLGGMGLLLFPATAWAGMPTIVLTDWAALRLETLSFGLLVFLLAAAGFRGLWNHLARDFPRLPRLSYGRALALLALWSAAMAVVLTMIAGSRELLTPGAWQRHGLLYQVTPTNQTAAPVSPLEVRHTHLRQLQLALWQYAAAHSGQLPAAEEPSIPASLWEIPGMAGARYGYVPDQRLDATAGVLAYELELFGPERLVLDRRGELLLMSSEELRRQLGEESPREKQP